MATYDTDGNGSIDPEEFSCFLNSMRHEIEKHKHQLVYLPVLGLGSSVAGGGGDADLVTVRKHPMAAIVEPGAGAGRVGPSAVAVSNSNCDNAEGRYVPPMSGSMLLQVTDTHTFKDVLYTVASCNRCYSDLVAQNTPDPEALKRATMSLTQIRVDDAVGICQAIAKKKKSEIHVLVSLLRQVPSPADARLLISEVIDGDRTKMVKLRREMGQSLKATLGMLNGYYCLDMSVPTERKTLVSLYEQSRTLNHHRASASPLGYGVVGDTSQKGNWSSLRNELYEGRPVVVDAEFIAALPAYGYVEFDYSGEERFCEGQDVVAMDFAVVNMLIHVGLVRSADLDSTMNNLKEMRLESNAVSESTVGQTLFERSWADALEIAVHHSAFYEHLVGRPDYLERAATLERCQFLTSDDLTPAAEPGGSKNGSARKKKFGAGERGHGNETPLRRQKSFSGVNESAKKTPSAACPPNSRLYDPEAERERFAKHASAKTLSRGNSVNNSPMAPTGHTPLKKHSSGAKGMASPAAARKQSSLAGAGAGSVTPVRGGAHTPVRTSSSNSNTPLRKVGSVPVEPINNNVKSPLLVGHLRTGAEVASFWKNHVLDNGQGLLGEDEEDAALGLGTQGYEDDTTKGDHFYGVIKAATSEEHAAYFVSISQNEAIPDEVKMAKLLDIIEESFGCYKWIKARHLALILNCVQCLPFGMVNRSKFFGNYRVEIAVMLFGHIVDRANFDLVLKELNPYETACVVARIGLLNFINPMRPEGSQSLDLNLWDQRQVAKMYALLEVTEPGENWTNKQFRWIIDQPPIPSWVLTKMWMSEEGMPARGLLDLTYYSGEGARLRGCQPIIPYRKSLLFMSALDESELRAEDSNPNQNPFQNGPGADNRGQEEGGVEASVGLGVLQQHLEVWRDYIGRDPRTPGLQIKPVSAPRRVRKQIGFSPSKGPRPFGPGADISPSNAGTPSQSPGGLIDTAGLDVSVEARLGGRSATKVPGSISKLSLSAVKRSLGAGLGTPAKTPGKARTPAKVQSQTRAGGRTPGQLQGAGSTHPRGDGSPGIKSLQSATLKQLQSPRRGQPSATTANNATSGTGKAAPAAGGARTGTVSTMKPNVTPRSVSTPRTRPGTGSGSSSAAVGGKGKTKAGSGANASVNRRNSLGSKTDRLALTSTAGSVRPGPGSGEGRNAPLETILSPGLLPGGGGGGDGDSQDVPPPTRPRSAEAAGKLRATSSTSKVSASARKAGSGLGGTSTKRGSTTKTSASTATLSRMHARPVTGGTKYAHK